MDCGLYFVVFIASLIYLAVYIDEHSKVNTKKK
jgi:hypothetical protein